MHNRGIRVLIGDDNTDMRKVRIAAPRDEILARLEQFEIGRFLEEADVMAAPGEEFEAFMGQYPEPPRVAHPSN